MTVHGKSVFMLIAEDDDDDYVLIRDALQENSLIHSLHRVKDGEELMDYLLHQKNSAELEEPHRPFLIVLDLNMPKKDGREAIKEIKTHPDLHRIPIVVLTTSNAEEDMIRSYDLGVNSYIRKPSDLKQLVHVVEVLTEYWFRVVTLPDRP